MKQLFHQHAIWQMVCFVWMLSLSACAGLPGKEIIEPEVFVRDFTITELTLSGMQGIISLDVKNPNDARLSARSLDYVFYIADYEVLSGATDENFTIPAFGQETIDLPIRVSYEDLLNVLPTLLQSKSADYTVKGNLGTTFITVPFSKRGQFALPNFTNP